MGNHQDAIDVEHEELQPEPEQHQLEHEVPPPAPNTYAGRALVPRGRTALIEASDPDEMIEKATRVATSLERIVRSQDLFTKIGKKDHIEIEGWQTLATLLGAAATIRPGSVRPVNDPATGRPKLTEYDVHVTDYEWVTVDGRRRRREKAKRTYTVSGYDWEAACDVYKDGVLIASAEAMVSRTEDKWAKDPDFALRSMAQTRAQSRAIAAAARWVVVLAGYSGTPAEEMDPNKQPTDPTPQQASIHGEIPVWAADASAELRKTARQALMWLLEDEDLVGQLWAAIVNTPANGGEEVIGFVPRIAAQTIVRAVSAKKRQQEGAPPPAEPEPEDTPAEDAQPLPGTLDPTAENIQAHCACKRDKGGAIIEPVDHCPIKEHGIPF